MTKLCSKTKGSIPWMCQSHLNRELSHTRWEPSPLHFLLARFSTTRLLLSTRPVPPSPLHQSVCFRAPAALRGFLSLVAHVLRFTIPFSLCLANSVSCLNVPPSYLFFTAHHSDPPPPPVG